MKIYKFGGASVRSAFDIKNLKKIIASETGDLVIVISAMGKTTNLLEQVCEAYFHESDSLEQLIDEFKAYHHRVLSELFRRDGFKAIDHVFEAFDKKMASPPTNQFSFEYDQIVHFGELLSTVIVSEYLNQNGLDNTWLDARDLIKTDNHYREARVLWEHAVPAIRQKIKIGQGRRYITQGFIGGVANDFYTTTLGREGSDYSGAILAYALNAESFTVWKDVAGVYNADPAKFERAQPLQEISYQEAVELTYYGAKVIHPKTIKPLQNKNIPMNVRSFIHPELPGTQIRSFDELNLGIKPEMPVYIFEQNQILISISTRDFSFVAESNLSEIYNYLSQYRIKVNLTQNSAISFSICVSDDSMKIQPFIYVLKKMYKVRFNCNMQLITIRHYTDQAVDVLLGQKEIFIEQRTRHTARFVVKM